MKGLTPPQSRMLDAIRGHQRATGRPPTLRELCEAQGIRSTNGVSEHLRALEKKGFIRRDAKSRGIWILDDPTCPTCGQPRPAT